MGVWSDVSGALDHAAGSTDEAVGRQFDNQQGGGVLPGLYDTAAGVGDAAAGDLDEKVGSVSTWMWVAAAIAIGYALVQAAPDEVSAV